MNELTRSRNLSPSSSLQPLFLSLCASSMMQTFHSISLSSSISEMIVSYVVISALNL